MTGGELYRTWFGLEGITPNPLGERLRRLQILSAHPERTAAQSRELKQLRSEVRKELIRRLGPAEGQKAFEDLDRGHQANYFPLRPRSRRAATPAAPLPIPPPSPIVDVSQERALLIDPAGPQDPLDHTQWSPTNTTFDRRDWIWTPLGLTDEGRATIEILKLGELADRVQGHVRTRLLPSIEEVEHHLAAGRIAEAHQRWGQLLADSFAPSAEWSAFTWHALKHLVPRAYRTQHQLAEPPRPGAP